MLELIRDGLWGWPLLALLLFTGILLTLRLRGRHLLALGRAFRYALTDERQADGEISAFGSLCTALSATIGTGNIVGVATAICTGGPGALFWMLTAALFGMATKYAEGLLAVTYRQKDAQGRCLGGPFYYITGGLGPKFRPLAKLFAVFGVIAGLFGIGTIAQAHSIVSAVGGFFRSSRFLMLGSHRYPLAQVITGLVITVAAALVICGGTQRIAGFSEVLVPFMSGGYILLTLTICFTHRSALPAALRAVFVGAFSPKAVCGAGSGIGIKLAIQMGVGRGMFSNEAGLGTAPIAAAAARTDSPVRQGLVSMLGTFIDTIVLCTLTGLSILVTGAWQLRSLHGTAVTDYAWRTGLPWNPELSSLLLTLCLTFFAFTTIVGWNFYAERCLAYLCRSEALLRLFRIGYILTVCIGPYLTVSAVWNLADICNALMAFPNLLALLLLSGTVAQESRTALASTEKHKKRGTSPKSFRPDNRNVP